MRVTTVVKNAREALEKAEGVRSVLIPAFTAALNRWMGETTNHIKQNKLTGQVLNVQTGNLRRSIIFNPAKESGGRITGSLQAGVGNKALVYARIHELGGIIRPVRANYLRFKTADGAWHAVKQVVMPARPYMRPGVEEMRPRLTELLQERIEAYARN